MSSATKNLQKSHLMGIWNTKDLCHMARNIKHSCGSKYITHKIEKRSLKGVDKKRLPMQAQLMNSYVNQDKNNGSAYQSRREVPLQLAGEARTHINTHTSYIYIYIYMHIHNCVCKYASTYVCMFVWTYVCMHTNVSSLSIQNE